MNSDVTNNPSPIPTVKVENLTVYRGNYLALRDVCFELMPGTDTAVVGPNGAGKSTLVQAILGLMPRTAGKIEIFGRPIERLGSWRSQLGYMPQNFIFDRSFPISVSELVGLGWDKEGKRRSPLTPLEKGGRGNYELQKLAFLQDWFWGQNEQKADAIATALKRVDAHHLRRQAIGTLSCGELKRVLLAYCLVMPRQLLVLDEAFAGVDMQGAADFYALLNELKKEENWAVLQVSHDIDMVSRHCDRVLCLNQTLVCSGHPEIALSPQNLLATYGPSFSRYHHQHDF